MSAGESRPARPRALARTRPRNPATAVEGALEAGPPAGTRKRERPAGDGGRAAWS